MAQGRPSAGDMTGRIKHQATKDRVKADQERAAEISMTDAAETEEELHGVFDPKSGERIDVPDPSYVAVDVKEDEPNFGQVSETILTGKETDDEIAPIIAAKKAFVKPADNVLRSSMVTIRVDADIEDMTYGMINGEPNNFTFKEGLSYKVPLAVADHLNERNLVRQWISN